MTETSARFALPFILPGQAQKELFHNEALARLDLALHCAIEGRGLQAPPEEPLAGQCWLVGPGSAGAWAGAENHLAMWTSGGWRFCAPVAGMTAWDKTTGLRLLWDGGAWTDGEVAAPRIVVDGQQVVGSRQPAVPSPSGGTIIDAEARAALARIIETLMSHGLID